MSLIVSVTLAMLAAPAEWREFRGPNGEGHYQGPPLVTQWGPSTHVLWKTPVPGKGWSSPVLVKGKLILTTAVPTPDDGQDLYAIAYAASDGKELWKVKLFTAEKALAGQFHKKNSHASPTPVTDGERVWVHFGHMGVGCLDLDGKEIWKTQKYVYKPVHGNGGSPILVGENLVFSVDGADQQYVVALNKTSGSEVWKTDRNTKAGMKFTFSTPQALEVKGRTLIISPSSDFVAAYDAASGKEIWRVAYPTKGWSVITRPVLAGGFIFVQTGYPTPHLIAIDPAVSGEAKFTWANRKEAPNTPTPIAVGDELYVIADDGRMTCFDAKTGKIHWTERLKGKAYSASPIVADGLLYVTSEEGVGQMVKATKAGFEEVSSSDLKEKTFATFVPADGALYVRTETLLYKFGK